jgi:hypothetical protein
MAIINLTFVAAAPDVLAGIPKTVSITSDIYCSIFYTLDGTDPSIMSTIYTGPINLPTNKPTVVLKAFATDGASSNSDIITNSYYHTSFNESMRISHASTVGPINRKLQSSYPFGAAEITSAPVFGPVSRTLNTVYDELLPATPHGFDGYGNPTNFTNAELLLIPTDKLEVVQTETNQIGERGPGIGTLPKITYTKAIQPTERSVLFSNKFNPKAFVIFQDLTKPQMAGTPQMINGQNVDLQAENAFDGEKYYASALEASGPRGTFINSFYNEKDKTITMYYFDSSCNRWLIVKSLYENTNTNFTIFNTVFPSRPGSQYIYKRIPFRRTYLF